MINNNQFNFAIGTFHARQRETAKQTRHRSARVDKTKHQNKDDIINALTTVKNGNQDLKVGYTAKRDEPLLILKTDTWQQKIVAGLYASSVNLIPDNTNRLPRDVLLAQNTLTISAMEPILPAEPLAYPQHSLLKTASGQHNIQRRDTMEEILQRFQTRIEKLQECKKLVEVTKKKLEEIIPSQPSETSSCTPPYYQNTFAEQDYGVKLDNVSVNNCLKDCPKTIRDSYKNIDKLKAKIAEFELHIDQLNESPATPDDPAIRTMVNNKIATIREYIADLSALVGKCQVIADKMALIQANDRFVANNFIFQCADLLNRKVFMPLINSTAQDDAFYFGRDYLNNIRPVKDYIDVVITQTGNARIEARRPMHSKK